MKLEFSQQIFEKFSNQISRKSVQLEPNCSIRTGRHDEANSRFSQLCKRAKNDLACQIGKESLHKVAVSFFGGHIFTALLHARSLVL